jgi:hypothetical protein
MGRTRADISTSPSKPKASATHCIPSREPAARALTHMVVRYRATRGRMRAGSGAAHVLLGFRNENGRTGMRLCRRIERATAGAPATVPAVIGWLAEVHEPAVMLSSGTVIALPPGMSAAEFPVSAVVKVATMEQDVRIVAEQIDRVHG